MLGLGALLLALFVTWIATAQAIYVAAFGYETAAGISDFARRVLTTPQGWWLIIVGCVPARTPDPARPPPDVRGHLAAPPVGRARLDNH